MDVFEKVLVHRLKVNIGSAAIGPIKVACMEWAAGGLVV